MIIRSVGTASATAAVYDTMKDEHGMTELGQFTLNQNHGDQCDKHQVNKFKNVLQIK